MRLLHLSTGILAHTSWADCSSCLRFEGCLLQTACFSSFHKCSTGFRSGIIEGHFRIVQCFVLSHSWVFLAVWLAHYPVGGPMTCNWDQAFWHWAAHFTPECLDGLEISLYLHRFKTPCVRCSKAAPEHNLASSMFHSRYSVLSFVCFIFASVNTELTWLA